MSVRYTTDEEKVAMFDSTSGFAFGPVFDDSEEADDFLEYVEKIYMKNMLQTDIRVLSNKQLEEALRLWQTTRDAIQQ